MTDDSYRKDDEKEELVKKKKKESEKKDDEKKKSVAFKATTSKGKSKIESSSDETQALVIVMRLNHQVMKTQALVIVMTLMRRWLSLSSNLANS
jgi:hypothetical protein